MLARYPHAVDNFPESPPCVSTASLVYFAP